MLRARIFRRVSKFLEGVKRRKTAKSRRKLVLDDRASERPRARLSKQRGLLEAVLSSTDRRLTLRAATPRIYSISFSSPRLSPHLSTRSLRPLLIPSRILLVIHSSSLPRARAKPLF